MITRTIQPFIEAAAHVFQTMLNLELRHQPPRSIEQDTSHHDVSGVIGMSGDVVGVVILSFPADSAARIVEAFAGQAIPLQSDDFADAVGELVNIIAGNAKSRFGDTTVSIGFPSVVLGPSHKIAMPSDAPGVAIPFETLRGRFTLKLGLREAAGLEAKSHAAATGARS
ncbi:MAG: chemotaxis protein CheX [Phycisphaeraceae bacterium]|nr:chemotaxis protein CheX [Phycisphaeraceae bacterium]